MAEALLAGLPDDPAGALLPGELLAELADDWLSTVLVAAECGPCRCAPPDRPVSRPRPDWAR